MTAASRSLVRVGRRSGEPGSRPRRMSAAWSAMTRAAAPLVLLALAAAGIAWLRIPTADRDVLWAEDGRNFLQGALDGTPAGVFQSYAGYLHVVPRMLATLVVATVPVGGWAVAMTAGSCLIAGILALVVFVSARTIIPAVAPRLAIALLTVLAPLASREVLGNAANLHSLFLWTLFWMLLGRPRSRAGAAALAAVGLLGALTEIQTLLLLPLLLVGWRDRRRWLVRGAVLLGVLAQLTVTVLWPRGASGHPPIAPLSLPYGYLINVLMPFVLPRSTIGPTLVASGPLVGVLLLAGVGACAAWALHRGRRPRIAVIALLAGSVLAYCAAVVDNPNAFLDYAELTRTQLENVWFVRYGVVPSMMVGAVVIIGLFALFRRIDRGWIRVGIVAIVVIGLVVNLAPEATRRTGGPSWSAGVVAAAEQCERRPGMTTVSVAETISWRVVLPCTLLTSGG